MATNYTAPFGRIRWYDDIIPMSQVGVMKLLFLNGEFIIQFYYVDTNQYSRLYFKSETQRDEFLEKLNKFMNKLTYHLRNDTDVPHLGWTDFTPEPQKDVNEVIDEVVDEVVDDLQEKEEKQEEEVEEVKLQEPDTRPTWKKLLNPR